VGEAIALVSWPPGGFDGVSAASVFHGFDAYGRDGKPAYTKTIEVPGGSQVVVRDVDFDAEGNARPPPSAAHRSSCTSSFSSTGTETKWA
jgi:hypothetical protein